MAPSLFKKALPMKRFVYVLLICLALPLVYWGCSSDEEEEGSSSSVTFSVSPTSISLSATASTATVSVTSSASWTASVASDSRSWCSISSVSGSGSADVTISASANTSEERSATITFTSSGSSIVVTVTQEEGSESSYTALSASPATFDGDKKAAITYQLLVYSFADSDGDGYGDIQGIIDHLDYLDEIGATALWLSPIHPSSSYHGYDVLDYSAVNEEFGDDDNLQELIDKAHAKDIKIYLDYVLNHSASKHPWFLDAAASEDSEYRDYYIFSDDPEADIAAGNIAMIATEGSSGYDSGQWFAASSTVEQRLRFDLDWTGSSPTITVTETTEDASDENPDTSTDGAKYLYYGDDGECPKFYDNGDGTYYLVVDFSSSWGFLIRTSNTSWTNKTKYGSQTSGAQITYGEPFTLYTSSNADSVYDILMPGSTMFHSHMWTNWFADLNYGSVDDCENSGAFKAVLETAEKWINMGVDGFRLDAVKHIYHNASSTENPTFLGKWYDACSQLYTAAGGTDDFYMVGEVFSEASAVAPYYAGLPACFEFSFWWRLSEALNNSVGNTFVDYILGYQNLYAAYRSDYIEATKLSNHDEERAASTLGKDEAKMKQAAAFLLTAPGEPYIYQGEELGYYGTQDNGDEYVRTPMMWNSDGSNLADEALDGKIDESMLTSSISVESQDADSESLLNVYRTFAELRNNYSALATGTISKHGTYNSDNSSYPTIACWYMTEGSQVLLVVHNVGTSTKTLAFSDDDLSQCVGLLGSGSVKVGDSSGMLKLDGNSSAVFVISE